MRYLKNDWHIVSVPESFSIIESYYGCLLMNRKKGWGVIEVKSSKTKTKKTVPTSP